MMMAMFYYHRCRVVHIILVHKERKKSTSNESNHLIITPTHVCCLPQWWSGVCISLLPCYTCVSYLIPGALRICGNTHTHSSLKTFISFEEDTIQCHKWVLCGRSLFISVRWNGEGCREWILYVNAWRIRIVYCIIVGSSSRKGFNGNIICTRKLLPAKTMCYVVSWRTPRVPTI